MQNYEAEEYRRGYNAGRETTRAIMELVKLRVSDVLVDGDVPPWIIINALDAVEEAFKERR